MPLSSLENFAGFLRNTPPGKPFLKGIGVNTRDGNGKMRENVAILTDVGKALAKLRDEGKQLLALAYANILGIDEHTMLALQDGTLTARMDEYRKTRAAHGIQCRRSVETISRVSTKGVGPLATRLEVLGNIIALRLLPIAWKPSRRRLYGSPMPSRGWTRKPTAQRRSSSRSSRRLISCSCSCLAGIPVFTALGVAVTAATWPFILLIAAAAAVGFAIGAGVAYIVNHWNGVKQWFSDFFRLV